MGKGESVAVIGHRSHISGIQRSVRYHRGKQERLDLQLTGEYKCLKCGYEFELTPNRITSCIECGHDYVKWLNYEELNDKYFHN